MSGVINVAVVSSRLRRLAACNDPWFNGLRAVLRKISTEAGNLIVGERTAGADFIRHAAMRLDIPHQTITPLANTIDLEQKTSVRDSIVLQQADVVYVLKLRSGGNLHRLLRERLQQGGNVIFVDLDGLQPESVRRELCELGAATWKPPQELCAPLDRSIHPENISLDRQSTTENSVFLIEPFPRNEDWQYLTHTTRSCPGPWPNESFADYADSLLESHELEADHSTVGTLRRIIRQKQLIASGQTIRGGYPVVSFSFSPLEQLPLLHQFRPHRVRWDFEPYGLCIHRDWLIRRGTRPVSYGDESTWKSLSIADRPFFQLSVGNSGIDWTTEREWRHLGNLDLSDLKKDEVFLFVPDFHAAKILAEITDWPITLWPRET